MKMKRIFLTFMLSLGLAATVVCPSYGDEIIPEEDVIEQADSEEDVIEQADSEEECMILQAEEDKSVEVPDIVEELPELEEGEVDENGAESNSSSVLWEQEDDINVEDCDILSQTPKFAEIEEEQEIEETSSEEDHILSISFSKKNPWDFIEHMNGYDNNVDDSGGIYYSYRTVLEPGDILTIYMDDGTEIRYEFGYWNEEYCFQNIEDPLDHFDIFASYFDIEDYQDEKHWYAGNTYSVTITYKGHTCEVPATVSKNPVKSIEAVPMTDYCAYENTNGKYVTGDNGESYFQYNIDCFNIALIVNREDGTSASFHLQPVETDGMWNNVWVNDNDSSDIIDGDDVWYYHYQNESHWVPGQTYDLRFEYMGRSSTVPFTVLKNNISGIKYIPASSTIYEDEVYSVETDENGIQYNNYWVLFKVGDVLIVSNNDGSSDIYEMRTFTNWNNQEAWSFFNTKTGKQGLIGYIYGDDHQQETHWKAENTYKVTYEYAGYTYDASVTLLKRNHVHIWDKGKEIKKSNCTSAGVKEYKCTICGEVKKDIIQATGHIWNNTYSVDKAPNTSAVGQKSIHCKVCNAVRPGSVQIIPKLTPKKAVQPMTVKTKSPSLKASKLKKKKQTIKKKKAFTIKNAQGTVSFKKKSGSKKLTISKTGVITVKKGTKKGNYIITVAITAAGNAAYEAGTKTVTVKVKVK